MQEDDIDKALRALNLMKYGFYALIAIAILILALPTLQPGLYKLFVGTPGFVQWTVVAALLAGLSAYKGSPALFTLAGIVFVVMALVVGPVAGGVYAHSDMANQMQSGANELDALPNTSQSNVRVLPRSVSDNYAQSSMQYPQFKVTDSDIAYENDSYVWSYALAPDNFMVSWLGNQKGALYVDMTTTNKKVTIEETEFQNGRGQILFDSYTYQNVLHTPFKQHNWDTTFNARANGESYIAHSTTVYEWKFRMFPVPQFYAIPHHGSVEVMEPDGSIESLSPEEARNSPRLRGQNYYPYSIAMFKVESMQYVHGALNKWFWKEDVLAVADLPEGGNSWPITVPTEAADPTLTYFIATEPAGSGDGVYEVWTVDGQTGETGVERYDDSQIGPQKAVEFVERHPDVNRLSNANAVAPIPVVKDGHLYWHVKVVSNSLSGVVYTAFVNAETGDVTLVEGDDPIYAFLSEEEVEDITSDDQSGQEGMTVRVVVTDSEGNIVRTENITVPRGGDMELQFQNNQTESDASA